MVIKFMYSNYIYMRWARMYLILQVVANMPAPIIQNAINNKQQDGVSYQPVQGVPSYLPPPYWKLPNAAEPMLPAPMVCP